MLYEVITGVIEGPFRLREFTGDLVLPEKLPSGEHGEPLDEVLQFPRITSYNVCYTKLLRRNFSSSLRSNSSARVSSRFP